MDLSSTGITRAAHIPKQVSLSCRLPAERGGGAVNMRDRAELYIIRCDPHVGRRGLWGSGGTSEN